MTLFPPTHAELVQRAVRWLRGTMGCTVVFAEMSTLAPVIPDAIGWRFGSWSVLVECKTSRSDFKADQKKAGWNGPEFPGQERWYLTPPGLLKPTEMPDGWGLIEAHERCVRVAHLCPRTRNYEMRAKHSGQRWPGGLETVFEPTRAAHEVTLLTSAVRRHQIGVEWKPDDARFAPYKDEP